MLVTHHLFRMGVLSNVIMRVVEDRIARAIESRGAHVFSTSEWV